MKNSTEVLIKALPILKKYMPIENEGGNIERVQGLDEIEKTFLRLAHFFEYPDKNKFDIRELYNHLSDEQLLLALNAIKLFFEKDTFLIKKYNHSIIRDANDYYNQKEFVEYLNEHGQNYSAAKLSVYIQREVIPEPDLIISDTRYWLKSTCEKFVKGIKGDKKSS